MADRMDDDAVGRLNELADSVFGAVASGDADAFAASFEDGGVVIRNGGDAVPAVVVAEKLRGAAAAGATNSYRAVVRGIFPGGFVEEHTVDTRTPDADEITRHTCVVAEVGPSGLIASFREYV